MVAYERTIGGIQHIYLQDLSVDPLTSLQITNGANASSFRPKVSSDGTAVVFHSLADNLTIGDTNGHEDIFYYSLKSGLIDRAIDFDTGGQTNGGSFYPDISSDGKFVVFETESTNFENNQPLVRHIALWDYDNLDITIITSGANGDSRSPSISDNGGRIVFASDATNLITDDTNGITDVFLFDRNANPSLTRISLAHDGAEAEGGPSDQPQISGDGQKVTFRSEATNLITGKGISFIEVISGGVGYLGNPTISVNDSGGTGTGAQLRFFTGGVDIYGQITPTGIEIFDHGQNYDDPFVTIVPDPAFPAPSQVASVRAHITHPQGEVYAVDLNVGVNDPNRLRRISENSFGVGGNFPSRDAFPSDNGEKIVFSTKASNLQADRITRADGKTFYNYPVSQAVANAIVLGGIGEIEVDSPVLVIKTDFLLLMILEEPEMVPWQVIRWILLVELAQSI